MSELRRRFFTCKQHAWFGTEDAKKVDHHLATLKHDESIRADDPIEFKEIREVIHG